MSAVPDRLDLLLASEDRPALEHGLPGRSAEKAPRQLMPGFGRRRHGEDASDLPKQRWGIVAPEGPEGDRMLEATQPLQALREQEQGAKATIFRVRSDMNAKDAKKWKDKHYAPMAEREQPYYLMLLGDMHHTPLDLQYVLSNDALVGRVHFAKPDGQVDVDRYAAYANKVVRYATDATPEPAADLLYYVAPDGSPATILGKHKLIQPAFERSTEALGRETIKAASVQCLKADTVSNLLAAAGGSRPSVLLSVSHGLGAPRRGFRTVEEQWRRQGALMVQQGEILDAEGLTGQPFLPGGMWFFWACFGVGTPRESAYHPWLSVLRHAGEYSEDVKGVLASLPKQGDRGFIAALPQAALANPEGPLAVIGHIDLAWTYVFTGGEGLSESREARIRIMLEILLRGQRAGVALNKLMDDYREANHALTDSYEMQKNAEMDGKPDPIAPAELAHQWMLRNDLRAYVMLGDPAVRLPLRQFATPAPVTPDSPAAVDQERIVLETLRGEEAPKLIAARAQIPLSTLWEWVDAHRATERARRAG